MGKKLEQLKGKFKVAGIVTRIDKDKAFEQELVPQGKHAGKIRRKLKFGVKTSKLNEITVEMFDHEPQEVFMWNSKLKEEDDNYKGTKKPFGDWEENRDKYREDGYTIIEPKIGFDFDEAGKLITHGVPSFVAQAEIYDNIDNGDVVYVEGEIRHSSFEGQDGNMIERTSYTIKKLYKSNKEMDFEAQDFEELAYFEQPFIFVDAQADKKKNKIFVTGRVIDYKGDYEDVQYVVKYADDKGNLDEGMVKLGQSFVNKFSFGDLIEVNGDLINKPILEDQADDKGKKKDLVSEFGGRKKPKHAQRQAFRGYESEMLIFGIDGYEEKLYEEEDFFKDDIMDNDEEDNSKSKYQEEFGGRSKKKKSPFENEEDGNIDISDDDLPF